MFACVRLNSTFHGGCFCHPAEAGAVALAPRVPLSVRGAGSAFAGNSQFGSRCRALKETSRRKGETEGKMNWSSPVFPSGVGARGEETAGEAQRLSLSDKRWKGQFVTVSLPTAAKQWNKCTRLSKPPHSSKQIPDERISCIWFPEAVWWSRII